VSLWPRSSVTAWLTSAVEVERSRISRVKQYGYTWSAGCQGERQDRWRHPKTALWRSLESTFGPWLYWTAGVYQLDDLGEVTCSNECPSRFYIWNLQQWQLSQPKKRTKRATVVNYFYNELCSFLDDWRFQLLEDNCSPASMLGTVNNTKSTFCNRLNVCQLVELYLSQQWTSNSKLLLLLTVVVYLINFLEITQD